MLFNSFSFLIFFPVVCLVYFIIPYKIRYIFLLFASYFFYMSWNPKYAVLMLTSTIITYLSGILIGRAKKNQSRKKLFVILSFVLNLGILFFFKYFGFTMDSVSKILGAANIQLVIPAFDIILPVGISFYTFQALSYTMDVYREDIYPEKNFFKYALFVSFFPQLVAGPIERSKNLLKQISVKHSFSFDNMRAGLIIMGIGYFQKMVLADNIAVFVDQVYNNHVEYNGTILLIATLLFAVQIYCDFSGYSYIAIGAAKVMGFTLMENFNAPYFADSVSDFWRRWHISLSTWFRDYLYIPLGGNRKGRIRKYFNLMVVFLASGLWHGASWHFVAWGFLNGIYQIIGEIMRPLRDGLVKLFHIERQVFSHRILKIITTFILVDFSWIFFRANGMKDALMIIKNIFTNQQVTALFDNSLYQMGMIEKQFRMIMMGIVILAIIDYFKYKKINIVEKITNQGIWLRWTLYFGFIFGVLVFGAYGPKFDVAQFIYFQF